VSRGRSNACNPLLCGLTRTLGILWWKRCRSVRLRIVGGYVFYPSTPCTVNTGENVPWEYTENEVCVGAMFPSTAHLKNAVKQWSTLTLHREFRVVKSSPSVASRMVVLFECMQIWGSGTITYRWKKWKVTLVPLIVLMQGTKHFSWFCCKPHVPSHSENPWICIEGNYRCNWEKNLGTPSVMTRHT
jgi:hypothetical protein